MADEGYLFEMQRLAFEMEKVVEKYGVKDRAIYVVISGLIGFCSLSNNAGL